MRKRSTNKQPVKERGHQAALIRRLMFATGLSDEACRKNLNGNRRPHNPLVAAAWDKALVEAAKAPR